jgi:hypothetical protein
MRTNRHPSFKRSTGVFFLRGADKSLNEKEVTVNFKSTAEAENAVNALRRLVSNTKMPEGVDPEHKDKEPLPGGTTDVRMAFLTKAQAKALHLTGKDWYKDERRWKPTKPIITENPHYNEHIAQVVDVLNKAVSPNFKTKGVINSHKVTHEQASWTYQALCNLFDEAEKNGCLVALWRAVTGLRGPDFVDRSDLPSTHR